MMSETIETLMIFIYIKLWSEPAIAKFRPHRPYMYVLPNKGKEIQHLIPGESVAQEKKKIVFEVKE